MRKILTVTLASTPISTAVIATLALMTLSCAPVTPPATSPAKPPTIPANLAAEYDHYAGTGTSSISGQAFLRTRGGDVRYAAGELVTAEPATLIAIEYMKRTNLRPTWREAVAHRRSTFADGEGRFTFRGLPAGQWLILSQVYWQVPVSGALGVRLERTGGVVFHVVQVGEGGAVSGVVLIPWVRTAK